MKSRELTFSTTFKTDVRLELFSQQTNCGGCGRVYVRKSEWFWMSAGVSVRWSKIEGSDPNLNVNKMIGLREHAN